MSSADAPSNPALTLQVLSKEVLADGVVSVELGAPDGKALPAWEPGAHVDLELVPGLVRQYSLCGSPDDVSSYLVAVLREPVSRGGSAFVHEQLQVGARVAARAPRNHFALVDAPAYLFVAGGIGITPMLPMVRQAEREGRPWSLLYGGRTRAAMSFCQLLEAYGDPVSLRPQDEHGLLDLGAALAGLVPGTAVYCCGPEPLLAAMEAACAQHPSLTLHVERFSAKAVEATGEDGVFEIELASCGAVLSVPAGMTIVQVLAEQGTTVETACEEGICGTCETSVLSGGPSTATPCSARRSRPRARP